MPFIAAATARELWQAALSYSIVFFVLGKLASESKGHINKFKLCVNDSKNSNNKVDRLNVSQTLSRGTLDRNERLATRQRDQSSATPLTASLFFISSSW